MMDMSTIEELLTCLDQLYAMVCIAAEVVADTGAMSQADANSFNRASRRFETALCNVMNQLDRGESDGH
jgi:hypothetical protein